MTVPTVKEILGQVVSGHHLVDGHAELFLSEVMDGKVPEPVLASFLTAMKMKGETTDELYGFVRAMRNHAIKPSKKFDFDFLDTCGTGGDGKGTLNVSTLSALTLASLGFKVAKHGNRSVSSLSGSSDILSGLGYKLDQSTEDSEAEFLRTGFVFLFAPSWHPAMKYAGPVRSALGFRTFFNLIGPLSNPFSPSHQLVGVYDKSLCLPMAEILGRLGSKRAIVCHSADGLDEFSIFEKTDYAYFDGKEAKELTFHPKELGLNPKELDRNTVFSSSKEGAESLFRAVLDPKEATGGTAMVALNAGVAMFLLGAVGDIKTGYETAKAAILEKKVLRFVRETLNLT
ncbi:anthranilate phosphoribosyltransferase [Leptospira congkakensis]|uniref:Anthranilate phosphoribosyltransferase n=1 Tax=Leptospira congkakensis TaxID=2484932 RepID=A0A4Z1AI90_9LEPT|nr:anthranilate phosphoribosyltransferase [Leptospira congkakensis]TGL90817.1 anthranilate phosphoribosyltransferase [Leptospira congkakensis]TGL91826.1 anthranilate phosphoribosyltransferase [Leptospira congkakensis]TGL98878.1 anthranilate phosphoribosyltransferase [Leptospira congkakensis]